MTMPSAFRYQLFVDALRKNAWIFDNDAETDERRLDTALAMLQGVVLYLMGDEEIAEQHLARPLGWLENAINDFRRGAIPDALKPATPVSGRPTRLAREDVQGWLAFCVELLVMAAKGPPDEAANFVARISRNLLRTERGDEITAKQILGWRQELNRGRGTAVGRDTLRRLRQEYGSLFKKASGSNRDVCERLAIGFIKGLSVVTPRSAPNRRVSRG